MLPMVWWASGLTTFAPGYVCCWGLAMLLACAAGGISFVIAVWRGGLADGRRGLDPDPGDGDRQPREGPARWGDI
ncbi:MAG: hypothetical protein EON47_00920 [Acetobacteraceae bacterium]|nr:MAG: hypothetical protein EON47_00920 [Acetobacteraceae bacterium]